MTVREIMTSRVITVGMDATIGEAADLMVQHNTSCLPVVDDQGKLVGILTHADFGFHKRFLPFASHLYTLMGKWVTPATLERVAKEVSSRLVRDVMTKPVITTTEDTSLADVAEVFMARRVNRLPVLRDGELVGIITKHDFVKLMVAGASPS